MVDILLYRYLAIIPSTTIATNYTRGYNLSYSYPSAESMYTGTISFLASYLWNELSLHIVNAPTINNYCNLLYNQ